MNNFSWDGLNYDSTGLYTNVYTDVNGCDSTVSIDLTINYNPILSYTNVFPSDSISCDGISVITTSSNIISYSWINSQAAIVSTSDYAFNLCNDIYFVTVVDDNGCSTTDTLLFGSIYGCTDPLAFNYYWGATIDDGSCIPIVLGCTDTLALNYDSTANIDDGSCCLINLLLGQIGQDIDGEAADDNSGISVSLSSDGNTVAIGALYNDGNGNDAGHVRIYENIGGSWSQIGQDIDGVAADDTSGISVSLSSDGNTVAVGAFRNDGNGTDAGHVRVYNVNNTTPCAGCTDPLALNYDSTFAYDDGSCIYPSGCTDSIAYNYDSNAITEDGSCLYCDLTNTMIVSQNTSGNCNGLIIANSTSSNPPITYLWSNGNTSTTLLGLCSGVYSVFVTDSVGCIVEDTVYMGVTAGCTDSLASNYDSLATFDDGSCIYDIFGCTDPTAMNYDPLATVDDGSCTYSSNCTSPKPTGLFAFDVIDTRAKVSWDNMNDANCMVWKYFVRYREVGTSGWTTKSAGVGNGLCNFGLNTVIKQLLNLTPSTTYEFRMKAFYCGGTSSNYSTPVQFTTADPCPDMTNLTATTFNANQSKVRFNWDTTGTYTFARILLRVDIPGSNWQTAGGFGVYYPTLFVNKFGLTPGQAYRAQGRTFCDSNITAYRSPTWTAPVFWSQPGSIKLEGGTAINNLDVYPNPSRDVFNISFNSDKKQDLTIRILNVVGAEVYKENKENFIGEYTKQVSLDNYGKGVYFLEIQTNEGIINKKLILQ